jgi:DNA polymerase-3 subunit alpha
MKMSTDEFYFKSSEEMYHAFRDIPEALTNTVEVAEKCNLEIEFGTLHLPHYEVPEGYTLDSYLNELACSGLKERYPHLAKKKDLSQNSDPAVKRLFHELDVITRMHYSGYFLIVWDFIKFARDHQIPVGPGRGSAAGSLVAYCLGITDIDPLEYHLLFERFLNPERISMPDIDIDFCMDKRQQVIDYVSDKYGQDNVAQIITFGTMAARGVIRDVGRVLGMPYAEVDKIAKLVPSVLNITLDEAVATEERLAALEKKEEQVRDLLDIARTLEGTSRHASTHAAGIVITPKPLLEYVPLYKTDSQNGNAAVTQYTMKYLESIGLLKMDFLGLRTLTVIADAIKLIGESRGKDINIRKIPMDDKKTFNLLCSARTIGIFQLESSGMRDLLRRLKPETFEDVIALVALFRPGPLGSGMVDDFIKRKHGLTEIEYELPEMEEILKETYGVMVYQEQVIQVASHLANFSLGEADILRRAMGKKKPEEMDRQREKFVKGATENMIPKAKAEKIFDLMAYFAGYGFNKSHSAAYAMIAYQTTYLKAHYLIEYMAALLNSEMDNTDKVVKFINECRELGIKILPPDVNESRSAFCVVKKNIRFGLAAVKNVGEAAVKEIISCRENSGPFPSLFDFTNRVDLRIVNRRVVESLIKCGAFDSTGAHRAQLMHVLDEAIEEGQKQQRDRIIGQMNLFNVIEEEQPSSAPVFSLPKVEKWSENQLLSLEKEVLGFYITGHPLAQYEKQIKKFAPFNTLSITNVPEGERVAIAGLVSQIKEIRSKNGDRMAFVTLEDMVGLVEVVVLPDVYSTSENLLGSDKPIFVSGEVYKKDDEVKIRAAEIISLNEIREKRARRIHINIFTPGLTEETLQELKNDLSAFHGKCEVLFHLRFPNQYKVTLAASRQGVVSPNEELIVKLEQIFGKESIYLE